MRKFHTVASSNIEHGPFMTTDRVRQLNRLQEAERVKAGYLFTTIIAAALIGWIALAVAITVYVFPAITAERSYNAIETHGQESDIIDYDVSFSDCLAVAEFGRSEGRKIICETVTR